MGELGGTLQVFFDDYELTQFFRVSALDRGIFLQGSSRTEARTDKRGVAFLGTNSNSSTITMSFNFYDDLIAKRRSLAKILSVDEPKKLVFSDEPNKYYLARPANDISIAEVFKLGSGTISFEVPEGVAYSTTETTFTNLDVSDNIQNYITVNNPGSQPMKLDLEATFHSDSGFFAVETEDGASKVLFGSPDELDGADYQISEKLVETTNFSDWKDGSVNHENPIQKACSMKMSVGSDVHGIMLGNIAGSMQNTNGWTGAIKTLQIPADSSGALGAKNWYLWARQWFETSKNGQTATTGVNVVASDGMLIASYIVEKLDLAGNTAMIRMKTGGKNPVIQKTINFTPSTWINDNPYNRNQDGGGGPWDLIKDGSKITFYWYGTHFSFVVPELEDVVATTIEYYIGQGQGRTITEDIVGGIVYGKHLRYLSFTKSNVEKWANNPNSFGVGDVLTYGQDGRNFYAQLNGIQALRLRDPGSTALIVPPGESKIYIAYSSFGSAPTVKLTGRAVYA